MIWTKILVHASHCESLYMVGKGAFEGLDYNPGHKLYYIGTSPLLRAKTHDFNYVLDVLGKDE